MATMFIELRLDAQDVEAHKIVVSCVQPDSLADIPMAAGEALERALSKLVDQANAELKQAKKDAEKAAKVAAKAMKSYNTLKAKLEEKVEAAKEVPPPEDTQEAAQH